MLQVHPLPGFFEPVGAWLHLLGALAFGLLTVPLLRRARGDRVRVALLAVYSFSCVLLLSVSGVFHMLSEGGAAREVLARLDTAAIFVLIAGTHTPVQGIFFRGLARWGVIATMWTIVAASIPLTVVFHDALPRGTRTGAYLLLGWIAGASGIVIWRRHGWAAVRLVFLGGACYSAGAILLGLDWPTLIPGVFGPHELWHVAVLAAMAMHWTFLYRNARRGAPAPPACAPAPLAPAPVDRESVKRPPAGRAPTRP